MAIEPSDPIATSYASSAGPVRKRRGLIGFVLADPLRMMLFMALNLVVVVGFVSTVAIYRFRRLPPKPITVQMALDALDRENYVAARHLAEKVIEQGDVSTEDWGGPDYVLGAFVARAAEKATGKRRIELYDLAARFLTESRERGFPKGREDTGLYALGRCLCACGRAADAEPVIAQALQSTKTTHIPELRRMLVDALLDSSEPDLKRALSVIDTSLADPKLTAYDRSRAVVERAKVLLRMDRLKECAAILDGIPADAQVRAEVAEIRGEILYREAMASVGGQNGVGSEASRPNAAVLAAGKDRLPPAAQAKLREAIAVFRHVPGQDDPNSEAGRRALYLTGVCLLDLNELRAAYGQFDRTCRLIPGTAESLAAAFQEAEVARRLDLPDDALSSYRTLTAAIPKPDELRNPWVSTIQLRKSLLAACQEYVKAGKFPTAIELAKAMPPLFSRSDAMEALARVYRAWGQNLSEQAESLPPDRAEKVRAEGRQQLRKAAVCYSAVAVSDFTSRQFPEYLFLSAESFLAGNDFRSAIRVFQQYLHYEPKQRHAQALVDMGDAQLSAGNAKEALESFTACIAQHPRDVAIYRARLLASRAASALGDPKKAAALLQENLDGEQLTPASKEWRESLFAMGELLHSQGRYEEATSRLDEALMRYPKASQADNARYLLADASRRSAAKLRAGLPNEISATLRAEHAADADRLLLQATEAYRQLRDKLGRLEDRDMTAGQRAILRNSRFALGETLYALEQYPEALRAYQSAANAYPNNPEVVEAFTEIANVYKRMGRPTEARAALEQARLALRRIPEKVAFTRTTNYDRAQWGAMLDWMCTLQP